MSMRLPLYSTVFDRPPMSPVASRITTSLRPARTSSRPAVRPAGPAPMMTVSAVWRWLMVGVGSVRRSSVQGGADVEAVGLAVGGVLGAERPAGRRMRGVVRPEDQVARALRDPAQLADGVDAGRAAV